MNFFKCKTIIITLTIVFICNSISAFSQDDRPEKVFTSTRSGKALEKFNASTEYMIQKKFKEVEILCKKAIQIDSEYVDAYMRLAAVYNATGNAAGEKEIYAEVVKIQPEFPDAWFNYGYLSMNDKEFERAIECFNKFLTFESLPEKFVKKAYWNIDACKFRDYAYKHPVPFNPQNLGNAVNTPLDEYWPVLTADEQILYFTRRVTLDWNSFYKRYNFNEDVFVSNNSNGKWGQAVLIPGFLNSPDLNEGAISISPDGKYMYLTICSENIGYGSCDIYISENKDGKWTQPKSLGPVINTRFKETQPSISFDGKTLYFSSDREGTYGKLDIWKSTLDENGKWNSPVNLGQTINGPANEESPFIHPDDKTLYFSSSSRIGMGGADIFKAKKDNNGNFYNVKNLGYPINTDKEEFALFVSASGKKAYFASDAGDSNRLDLYCFDLYAEMRPDPVCYLKGFVYDSVTKAKLSARFELINVETGQTVLVYNSDEKTGKFLEAIPSDANYMVNVSSKGYLFYSAHLPVKGNKSSSYQKDISLQPISIGKVIVLNNIFFKFDSFSLKKESISELKKVIDFLNEYPKVKVEIGGHTDSRGSDSYNQVLSENRARRVYEYLISVGKIDPARLSYKGYGETKPIDTNETDEGRANNRRTEFKITGI